MEEGKECRKISSGCFAAVATYVEFYLEAAAAHQGKMKWHAEIGR